MINVIISPLIFLLLFVLPYSLRAFLDVSLSNGTFIALLIFLVNILVIRNFRLGKSDLSFFKVIAISSVLLALHSIICAIFFQNDFIRLLLSFVFLFFLSYCAFSFKEYYSLNIFHIKFVFLVLIFISILSQCKFLYNYDHKSLIFFSEPSHFALIFFPFLFALIVISKNIFKFFLLLISFVIGVFLENLTFMSGIALCLLLIIPFRILYYIVPIFILTLAVISHSQVYYGSKILEYYFDRLTFSVDSYNLSTMVYLAGWDRGIGDAIASFGFGVGFQQFGIAGPESMLSELVISRFHLPGPLNLLDGGSLGAKLVGEFGIFGILLLSFYLIYFIKFIRLLNISNYRPNSISIRSIFFISCFVTFSLDIFVRGTGYFNPPFFFFLAAIFYLFPSIQFKRVLYKLKYFKNAA